MPDTSTVSDLVKEYRALDELEKLVRERMSSFRDEREDREVGKLIERAFQPKCEWDRKNMTGILTLALKPDEVGWFFKFCERLHRLVHRH